MGHGTDRLGFYHGPVLRIRICEDTQPSAPDDRPLLGQHVYQFIDRLFTDQSINRDSGRVWRYILTRCPPGDSHDFVDQILLVKVAAKW